MNRLVASATYTPRFVLTRDAARAAWPALPMAGRSRSVPAFDEDPLTMAAHVALLALDAAGRRGQDLAGVFLATCSSPYVVKSGAAVIGDYVNAPRTACMLDLGAGSHAGLLALLSALRDGDLAERGPILVIGADAQFGPANDASDLGFGAGAAAFLVGSDGFATLAAFEHSYSSYTNIWQPTGERHLQRYDDDRFERTVGYAPQMIDSLRRFTAGLDRQADWYALSLPAGGNGAAVAGAIGAPSDRVVGGELVAQIGDCGCANVLLNLALALERAQPGETILTQAYGSGAGAVSALIAVESDERTASDGMATERVELSYVQYAKHRGLLPLSGLPSMGSPWVAGPAWERTKHATVGLHAGRCATCGSLNFPPRHYCLDCRGQKFEIVGLPRTASVLTFNVQHVVGIGPEEAPLPICTALVDGEQPGRYGGKVAALVTDAEPDAIGVGTAVELIPRRGDVEDGLVKYGWKFRPRVGAR